MAQYSYVAALAPLLSNREAITTTRSYPYKEAPESIDGTRPLHVSQRPTPIRMVQSQALAIVASCPSQHQATLVVRIKPFNRIPKPLNSTHALFLVKLDELWFGGLNINPFARAYAPALATYGITQRGFIQFIDGLNEAWLINPSLNYFGMASGAAGMALSAEPFLIGPALGATPLAATGASAVATIQRTKNHLKVWNEKLFNPVGLQAKILKTDKLMPLLGYTGDNVWERYERSAHGGEEAAMDSGDDKSPEQIKSATQRILRQKMEPRAPYVMSPNFDVEALVEMEGMMKQWGGEGGEPDGEAAAQDDAT